MAVRQARALALSARDAVADRLMRKDLEGVVERLAQLDSGGEALGEEELEVGGVNEGWLDDAK